MVFLLVSKTLSDAFSGTIGKCFFIYFTRSEMFAHIMGPMARNAINPTMLRSLILLWVLCGLLILLLVLVFK